MKNIVKDYFTFSKKERSGIFILIVIIIGIFISARFFPSPKKIENKEAFQQQLADLTISIDSSKNNKEYSRDENYPDYSRPKYYITPNNFKAESFAFDPNTLDEAGWKKLGIREKTISTIQKFISKGFRFKKPEDINKVYGLRREDAERLIPYIHIAEKKAVSNEVSFSNKNVAFSDRPNTVNTRFTIIDINTADTAAFISLPGIGNKLALRIINFRQKLGGFYSVNQLSETYGIADSTFQLIKPRLQCKSTVIKTININTTEINELRAHPYIKWNIANAIINYRKQHGNYTSIEDLRKIDIVTDEVFIKIAPYLSI